MKVSNSNMSMFRHPSGGSSGLNIDKAGLNSDFLLRKTILQLRIYFHFNPKDLETALKMPEIVKRLKEEDSNQTLGLAVDNIICCRALINSGKFPELKEKLINIEQNLESLRKWPASPQPGGK